MAVKLSVIAVVVVVVLTCMCKVYGQTGGLVPCTSNTYSDYQCNDGNGCYSEQNRCDSYPRCSDKSDDLNCDGCSDFNAFYCQSSRQCVPEYYVCNGDRECLYGEDEDLPECYPTIWIYWTGGQLAGVVIGFVIFLVIVIAIVVLVQKKCKK